MVQKKVTLPDDGSLLDASIHHNQAGKTNMGKGASGSIALSSKRPNDVAVSFAENVSVKWSGIARLVDATDGKNLQVRLG